MQVLQAILEILLGGFTQTATAMGGGLGKFVESIFLKVAAEGGAIQGLSTFGTLVVCFAGISLALSLCYFVVNWLTSFGK